MDNLVKGRLIKAVGWVAVGAGLYLVYKGTELEGTIEHITPDTIIDAVFEVVEED